MCSSHALYVAKLMGVILDKPVPVVLAARRMLAVNSFSAWTAGKRVLATIVSAVSNG